MLRPTARLCTSSIKELQAAFRSPGSPFYLAPGEQGPESVDEPLPQPQETLSVSQDSQLSPGKQAHQALIGKGYDPRLFWVQQVVWGDQDSFQHVNNTKYVRYIESARINFLRQLGLQLGGEKRAAAFVAGKGVSLILKSITVDFKHPVTFPDTLLLAMKPAPFYAGKRTSPSSPELSSQSPSPSRSAFTLKSVAYSYAQQQIVAEANDVTVWYDYDKLKKCDPGDEYWGAVHGMMDLDGGALR
ncbi:Thioesterase/thiol ester dehydrase-isomerase [Pterulicium gracile]|uniref:Thioesterase/thiol ester dehydrase-isomerase n=1 Tax=Pterulicium gracile TaxID=1884261 RepID=A0A5C3QL55_9AGAR|nr:Thioesterase/thiol ester dehydrase-isomerase [Pterula gracilis]